jgi:hypothetical protein
VIALILAAAVGAGVAIPWALRADRADAHTLHIANCAECAADDEWLRA